MADDMVAHVEVTRDVFDLDQIDAYLARVGTSTTDAELREHFGTYSAAYPSDMPADPFAVEYRKRVLEMYAELSGRSYDPANEVTMFDVESATTCPFPYPTRSAEVVGDHLMLVGLAIRTLRELPPGSAVLDCGAGWGNTSLALAKSGYQVTALEVDDSFAQLIAARAAHDRTTVEVVHGDFLNVFDEMIAAGRSFDAVLFFESFHHCDDPVRLVSMLDAVVAPGGYVVFCSEPISDDFPVPWGVRLDGESLWAIRVNGWLELGFQSSFFRALLKRHGWTGTRAHMIPHHGTGNAWVARREHEVRTEWTAASGLLSNVGVRSPNGVATDGHPGFLVFGPYAALPEGPWRFTVHVASHVVAPSGDLQVDVVIDQSLTTLARRRVVLARETSSFDVDAMLPDNVNDLEVRVAVTDQTRLCVTGITASRLTNPVRNHVEAVWSNRLVAAGVQLRRLIPRGKATDRLADGIMRRISRFG